MAGRALDGRSDGGAPPTVTPDRLRLLGEELARARRQVARLEEEHARAAAAARQAHVDPPRFDESPRLAAACNALICAIVALPVVLALVLLVQRLFG